MMEQNDRYDLPSEKREITIFDLVSVAMKHKWMIVMITAVTTMVAIGYAVGSLVLPPDRSYLPNVFTARALVMVSDSSSGGLSSMLGDAAGLASLAGVTFGGGKSNGEFAIMLAQSNSSLDELSTFFNFSKRYKIPINMKTDTRMSIRKNLSATFESKTGILSIAFTDIDPDFAMRVANRAVEILDRRFASLSEGRALAQKANLETKLADIQLEINRLEDKIKAFSLRYGVVNVDAMASEQVAILARLRSELIMKDMAIENYAKFSKIDDQTTIQLRNERDGLAKKLKELEGANSVLPSQRDIPKIAFEYSSLQRDLTVQMELFKIFTQQNEMIKLNVEGNQSTFQILEQAEAPDKKSGPARFGICVLAAVGGFLFSIFLAFFLDAFGRILKDPRLVAKLRGLV